MFCSHTFLDTRALEVQEFLQEHLLTERLGWDDYRELCEVVIKFLIIQYSDQPNPDNQIRDSMVTL